MMHNQEFIKIALYKQLDFDCSQWRIKINYSRRKSYGWPPQIYKYQLDKPIWFKHRYKALREFLNKTIPKQG